MFSRRYLYAPNVCFTESLSDSDKQICSHRSWRFEVMVSAILPRLINVNPYTRFWILGFSIFFTIYSIYSTANDQIILFLFTSYFKKHFKFIYYTEGDRFHSQIYNFNILNKPNPINKYLRVAFFK